MPDWTLRERCETADSNIEIPALPLPLGLAELLTRLEAAFFPYAGEWTLSDCKRLADAGVFDGNPNPYELRRRVRKAQEAQRFDSAGNAK